MHKLTETQLPWIRAGYAVFAKEGPVGLKVERLSRIVKKNKSSFYHFFADLDCFTDDLLIFHLARVEIIGEKERACNDMPELIEVIVEHKEDLLFNRQLRVHRQIKSFEECFIKTNQQIAGAIMVLWAEALGLPPHSYLAKLVLTLSLENFYLQITEETLNSEWLNQYFNQLKQLVKEFKKVYPEGKPHIN